MRMKKISLKITIPGFIFWIGIIFTSGILFTFIINEGCETYYYLESIEYADAYRTSYMMYQSTKEELDYCSEYYYDLCVELEKIIIQLDETLRECADDLDKCILTGCI